VERRATLCGRFEAVAKKLCHSLTQPEETQVSESHDEALDRWYRDRAEDWRGNILRRRVSPKFSAPPICKNPALQKMGLSGLRELSEEEQDRHDQRFLEGKYASKTSYVPICSFYKPYQLEQPVADPASAQVEMRRRLWGMSSGEHIRLLRKVLGWTQERAAVELGISRRSVIRHEQGRQRRTWMRISLETRLRELEAEYAKQLAAYLGRGEPLPT
jgi:DNA-binding XRE family transcriptional regulator